MAVDGNFHLGRNNKGGGPSADPPMTGDWGFWAIQGKFDDYVSAMEKQPVKEDKVSASFLDSWSSIIPGSSYVIYPETLPFSPLGSCYTVYPDMVFFPPPGSEFICL